MSHVSIDLETLGTVPGSIILSIGAVIFDPTLPPAECLKNEFYCVVSTTDSSRLGMSFSMDTIEWWKRQSPEARKVLDEAQSDAALSLENALQKLADFIRPNDVVWSNGANFDQPLLAVAYDKIGRETPWKFWNGRCHRTVLSLHSNPKALMPENQLAHNALEDAKTQAKHLVIVANALGLKLK